MEVCGFCESFGPPPDLLPIGPVCGQPAVEVLTWSDGRTSVACKAHGADAVDPDTVPALVRVEAIA